MRRHLIPIAALASLAGTSCSPHKVTKNPAPPTAMPTAYTSIDAQASNLPDYWWRDFGDAALDQLVGDALRGNLQVRAAWQRLHQARFVAEQHGASKFPTLHLEGSVSKTEPSSPFGSSPLSLQASYEIDIFKKLSNSEAAAVTDAMAARDQVESLAMSLVSQIAETWFSLTAQRARLLLLDEQIKVSVQFLKLAELRLAQGLGSGLDVLQQRQQLAQVEGQRPLIEASLAVLQHQLAILTGRAPGSLAIAVQSELPPLPPRPSTGVPADLLLRRPDVRAARLQVESADYRVAVAVANRLPSLRIGGGYGPFILVDTTFATQSAWTIVASLFAPIFDAGRLKAEVGRNEALVKERSFNYGQVLLQAIVEVENAVVQETKQLAYVAELEQQLVIAEQTLTEARRRYSAGVGNQSFLQILTALSNSQQIEQVLLQARKQALSYRIQLCRSLGAAGHESYKVAVKGQNHE